MNVRTERDLKEYSRIWDNDNGAYVKFFEGKCSTLLQQRGVSIEVLRSRDRLHKRMHFFRTKPKQRVHHANHVIKVLPFSEIECGV